MSLQYGGAKALGKLGVWGRGVLEGCCVVQPRKDGLGTPPLPPPSYSAKKPRMNKCCRVASWLGSLFTAVGRSLGNSNRGPSCATKSGVQVTGRASSPLAA